MLRGIDVSHHQHPSSIKWDELAKSHAFVYARATYGTRPDQHFREHVQRAKDHGLAVGGYHFLRQTQPAEAQIDAFLTALALAGVADGDLLPVLDLEENPQFDKFEPRGFNAVADAAIAQLRVRFGTIVIYATRAFYRQLGKPSTWAGEHLWVAHWKVPEPLLPDCFSTWTYWQHKVAPLPDVSAAELDQNYFHGSNASDLPRIVEPRERVTSELPPPSEYIDVTMPSSRVNPLPGERSPTLADVFQRATEMVEIAHENRSTLNSLSTRINQIEANYEVLASQQRGLGPAVERVLVEVRGLLQRAADVQALTTQQVAALREEVDSSREVSTDLQERVAALETRVQHVEAEQRTIKHELQKLQLKAAANGGGQTPTGGQPATE